MPLAPKMPREFLWLCRRLDVSLTRYLLVAKASHQELWLFQTERGTYCPSAADRSFARRGLTVSFLRRYLISTSRFGTGQQSGSYRTPLGLHRIAEKVGAGFPIGTVFEGRRPAGSIWDGKPDAAIAHRILWLEGLESGFNRGGKVDTHGRYIYIHGLADEPSLGRPASRGCIHLAGADLLPLFDRLPLGTLLWICE
jgi:L,D-transpeptidase YbiS